jgi:hypothetical protein
VAVVRWSMAWRATFTRESMRSVKVSGDAVM